MRDRNYEQGGVVSFVVIALTVAALLIGGIWLAKEQGRSVQNTPQTSSTQSGENEAAPNDATGGNSDQEQDTSTDAGTPSGSNSGSSSTESDNTTDTVANTGPSVEQLPSTGTGDVVVTLLSVSVIGAGVYAYRQSQKQLRHSALK